MNLTHEHPQTQSSKRTTDKERRQRIPSIPYSIVKEQKQTIPTAQSMQLGRKPESNSKHEARSFIRTG